MAMPKDSVKEVFKNMEPRARTYERTQDLVLSHGE